MADEVKTGSHSIGNMPGKEADIISVATSVAWRDRI
jgi:hypothetical protein